MNDENWEIPETGVILPETGFSVDETVAFAVAAESAGFDSLWCAEGWGYNPFVLLGRLGVTVDCPLGTAIANVHARTPSATAMNALTLHEQTGGRFLLGLGTSTRPVVEGFHGVEFENPVRRVRETIDIVRLALSGDRLTYDGRVGSLDGFQLDHTESERRAPILNAALGPTNLEMSTEYADGIVTYLFPVGAIQGALEEAAARSGGDDGINIIVNLPVCVSENPGDARAHLARHVAYYVSAVDVYHGVVSRNGFDETARRIRTAWQDEAYDEATTAVTDDLLDAVGVWGTPARARERFDEIRRGPVNSVLVSFPAESDDVMRRLALDVLEP